MDLWTPGEHDAAFHGGEHKSGSGFQIEAFGNAVAGLLRTLLDRSGPIVEATSDAFVNVTLAIVNFESELGNETAAREFRSRKGRLRSGRVSRRPARVPFRPRFPA